MIRDHALHLYFFVLPDVLGVDSILDIGDDPDDPGHTLLHDSLDIKRLGTDITNTVIGAAIHAPWPTIGGSLKHPDPATFPDLISRLYTTPKTQNGLSCDSALSWGAVLRRYASSEQL